MIRLNKLAMPPVLVGNGDAWKDEYFEALRIGTLTDVVRYRYRHPEIKAAILAETNGKCAYCESKITHVHPGEIDHILPRSERPDLICAWDNLTLVCSNCNREKSNYYAPGDPLVNPYVEDPASHVGFYGPMLHPRSPTGSLTVRKLKLNRRELFERRKERLEGIQNLIELWKAAPTPERVAIFEEELRNEASADREFAAMVEAFLYQAEGFAA